MEPTSPILGEEFVAHEIVFAKDQPQYKPLPAICNRNDGIVLTRWKLTDTEREAVALGADLFLSVYTFGQPLQPLLPEIGVCNADYVGMAERMGLLVSQET